MSLKVDQREGIAIVTPVGMLWGGEEAKIQELVRGGNQKLIVNLAETKAMNTLAINALALAYKSYRDRGAQMRLCCVGKRIDQVFVITRLCLVFGPDQLETEEEAIASFTGGKQESDAVSSPRSESA